MSEQDRIAKLELQVQALTERLEKLEAPVKPAYVVPGFVVSPPPPPPVIKPVAEPTPIRAQPGHQEDTLILSQPTRAVHPSAGSVPPKPATPDDLEYKFGINALLRGGAVVFLCAVLFLVPVLISRGLITPTVQFFGEVAICLGFIGVGIWKREEREDFGQLMVALGTAGMFASFVGGHLHKKLFDSTTLVALFMGLSLLTLVYSHWRSSKSFLAMGMLGGLAAAMLPLNEQRFDLNVPLHFMILLPAMWLTIRNRWPDAAISIWVISTLALFPSLSSSLDQSWRIGAVYLNCAVCLFGYVSTHKENKADEHLALVPMMLLISGGIAVAVDAGQKGTWHAVALTGIGLALAAFFRKEKVALAALLVGSLLVFTLLTPLGLTQPQAAIWYGVESLILMAAALKFRFIALYATGILTWFLSLIAYLVNPVAQEQQFARLGQAADLGFLALSAASTSLFLIYSLKNLIKPVAQEYAIASSSAILAWLFLRMMHVIILPTGAPMTRWDISLVALSVGAMVLTLLNLKSPRIGLSLTALGYSLAAGIVALPRTSTDTVWVTITGLWAGAISLLLLTGSLKTKDADLSFFLRLCIGAILSVYLVSFGRLVGAKSAYGVHSLELISMAAVSVIWVLLAARTRSDVYRVLAFLALALSSAFNVATGTPLSIGLAAVNFVMLWVLFSAFSGKEERDSMLSYVCTGWGWVLVHFIIVSEPVREALGLRAVSAATIGWTLYAIGLIAVGFWKSERYLRYGSLFIFCITVFKVFLIDLSELDSLIRVGVLMLLGMGMLAGGYRYLVWKRASERPTQAPVE
jgi:hypothetical protein